MTRTIAHRGPDDFGFLLLNSQDGGYRLGQDAAPREGCDVLLGSRRLSIVDLSPGGRQPMGNESGDVFVVFNGEIYNHLELRRELAGHGHVFRSDTDTEVIVHAYEQWGEDCVSRFNGMWAFAIWDQRTRRLFCSRDRFGIKPFYYYLDDRLICFASEIKAILPVLGRRPEADPDVLADYLLDGSLCRTKETFFRGILRLEPAHNLVVARETTRVSRYWDYRSQSEEYAADNPVETFRELLTDAVRLRSHADVPVGVALSGGLDSSSILALASGQDGAGGLKTFTAVFPGEPYDEAGYAGLAARHSGAESHTIRYEPENLIADLEGVIQAMDYPSVQASVLPRRQVMRVASRQVKVLLEGQGADEMLAGYVNRYFAPRILDEAGRLRRRRLAGTLTSLGSSYLEAHRAYGGGLYRALLRELAPGVQSMRRLRARLDSNAVYTGDFLGRIRSQAPTSPERIFDDRLSRLLHFDHSTAILPMLLKFGDAISMAHSVESRLPFLDHRLVEFVFRQDASLKLDGIHSKGILRRAMKGVVPEKIRSRTDKVGFATPRERWITEAMDSQIRPLLLSKQCRERGIFDSRRLERQLNRYSGKYDQANAVFRWLSVEVWYRLFIDARAAVDP